ncbi:MAG: hypothetical protein ABIQ11_08500 [Saprospiraceae bacterium]
MKAQPTYYLIYLTANDTETFHWDYFNFLSMARYDPGVERIRVYVAISLVRPWSFKDRQIIRAILNVTNRCNWLDPVAVILKGNIGRDFSSAKKCLEIIATEAADEDYILIRNRSSRGPYSDSWYTSYIRQFNRFENSGLTGNTLNMKDHRLRRNTTNVAHIQTYIYLSQWKYFSMLLCDFPGLSAINHFDAIVDGEICLSQKIMAMDLCISTLQYPDEPIHMANQNVLLLDESNKVDYQRLPFVHKRKPLKRPYWVYVVLYSAIIYFWMKRKQKWVYIDRIGTINST